MQMEPENKNSHPDTITSDTNKPNQPIVQSYVSDYLNTLMPKRTGILARLEKDAADQQIPIITPEVASLMEVLIKTTNPKHILEVGTAIGYSALLFSLAAGPEAHLITIEREPHLIDTARANIDEAGLTHQIKVMPGDATEVLPCLTEPVDMIFLDGAKGHYTQMLEHCLKLLKPGGLLISDNVLFRGMVASDDKVKRRKKTIVTRMRTYLETISDHPQLQTSLLPIGDGLTISLRLETEAEVMAEVKAEYEYYQQHKDEYKVFKSADELFDDIEKEEK